MIWVHEYCDRPLKVTEKQVEYAQHLRERVLEQEKKGEKVEGQLETQRVKLEGVRAELATTRTEVAYLTAKSSKYREDTLMEISRLQA